MSIRSLADFNGWVPLGLVMVLGRTATVASQGAHLVDQVIEVGTFAGHARGLSHGHGHRGPEAVAEGVFPNRSSQLTDLRVLFDHSRAGSAARFVVTHGRSGSSGDRGSSAVARRNDSA